MPNAVYPDPNFRTVTLSTSPAWQFDVKIDHQITNNHKIAGRYSRAHSENTVPTIVGNGDQGDGVIYLTTVQNGNLEYNWAIKPTALWTNRFSVDRVHAPGISNHYPTLSDVGLPSILNQNGLDRIPAINVGDPFLSIFTQCCVDTAFAHSLYSYSSSLQWVKGPHSITFGGEQRQFFNNFFQPDNPTGIFNFTRDVTTQDPNGGLGDNNQGNPFATMAALEADFEHSTPDSQAAFLKNLQSPPGIQIEASSQVATSVAMVEGKPHVFLANFAGLRGGVNPVQTVQSGIRVTVSSENNGPAFFLPFMASCPRSARSNSRTLRPRTWRSYIGPRARAAATCSGFTVSST